MLIAIAGDIHWTQYSSIVRKRGERYSIKLENLIKTINWYNRIIKEKGCKKAFYLGDTLDKPELNAEEISAFNEIEWADVPSYFLAGNHESGIANNDYSSAKIFNLLENAKVITKPEKIEIENLEIYLIPYIVKENREKVFKEVKAMSTDPQKHKLILMHNDIKGVQLGKYKTENGLELEELENFADLTINGHIHSGTEVSKKVINIGILDGLNFSEDGFKYNHRIMIIDTDNLSYEYIENPYAFNFVNITIDTEKDIKDIEFPKNNYICAIKCKYSLNKKLEEFLKENSNKIKEYRVTYYYDTKATKTEIIDDLRVNHIEAFKEYIMNKYADEIYKEELSLICSQ